MRTLGTVFDKNERIENAVTSIKDLDSNSNYDSIYSYTPQFKLCFKRSSGTHLDHLNGDVKKFGGNSLFKGCSTGISRDEPRRD